MRSERLLVVLKPKFLGDAVMATPVLKALRSEFEDLHVLAPNHIKEMLREDAASDRFLNPEHGVLAGAARLRKMKFQIALIINRSFRSALTAALAGIPQRIGHNTEGRGLLLTSRVPHSPERMEAESYGDLLSVLTLPGDYSRVELTATQQEREAGKRLLRGATIGVQPGASFEEKRIPTAVQAQVINRLHSEGHQVALIGGKDEVHFGQELESQLKQPVVNLIGKTSLRESMGVVASLQTMVGGSTGIMHIAAAVGTRTITVFGPTLPSRWGHPPPHISIRPASTLISDVDPDEILEAIHAGGKS